MVPRLNETTRYLCAATHLDEKFCDEAIAEFLVEPVRAIPPSPGVDSAAVLREAVAAQTRRRIRDGILLALLVVLVMINLANVILWTVLVAGARVLRQFAVARKWRRFTVLSAIAWIILDLPLPGAIRLLIASAGLDEFLKALGSLYTPQPLPGITLLIVGLLLTVLLTDGFTVTKLMTSSFRRDRFDPDARRAPSAWERLVRSLGHGSFHTELHRVARFDESSQAAGNADVIVYRGKTPFIGAGEQIDHHVIALPLEPSDDKGDVNPVPINVNDLHRHVVKCIDALRSPSSLSPARRLQQLRQREQVLIPADQLLLNRFAQMQPSVLPDLSRPPLVHLPVDTARALAENPLEWARYYNCFRVESWDRDLTTSCYLHIGTYQRMLYLEWTYCVLLPVNERYRSIDDILDSPLKVFGRSLVELMSLPLSVVQRIKSVFRRRTILVQHAGELMPARYGAAQSLRELAADTETQTYFQEVDVERYISIIDRALFRAVGQFLDQHGYSVVEFTKMAESVVNNFIQGDVIGSALGRGSTVSGSSVRVNTGRAGGTKGAK